MNECNCYSHVHCDYNESCFVMIYREDSWQHLLLDGKLTIHFRWRSLAFLSSLHTFTLIIERIDRVVLIASLMFALRHSLVIRANERVSGFAREPDVPRRLALSNVEHLVSLSSEHRTHRQTDRQTVENTVWIAL